MPTFIPNLPLVDKAGRGDLERQAFELSQAMIKTNDPHEFNCLSAKLDAVRAKFHKLYNVKEHPSIAPLNPR